jgi:hypothetical protein
LQASAWLLSHLMSCVVSAKGEQKYPHTHPYSMCGHVSDCFDAPGPLAARCQQGAHDFLIQGVPSRPEAQCAASPFLVLCLAPVELQYLEVCCSNFCSLKGFGIICIVSCVR